MRRRVAWAAVLALAVASCADDTARGVEALRAGEARVALGHLRAAIARRGEHAPGALHVDAALAALAVGDDEAAAASVEAAAARRVDDRGLVDFVRGVVAYRRALEVERRTADPAAEVAAFEPAVVHARAAADAFTRALSARDVDWPAARRNLERALAVLERAARRADPTPPDEPQDDEADDDADDDEEEIELPAHLAELPAARIDALLDVLASKQRDKRALRERDQRRRTTGDRDW